MCRTDGGDGPSVSSKTSPKARKVHRCHECGRQILPGEVYQKIWGIWEGDPQTYKTCAHCVVAQEWIGQNCEGWVIGEVIEDIEEHGRDYSRQDLTEYAARARKQWRTDDGVLLPVPTVPARLS